MSSRWGAVFIQVLNRTGPLMLKLSGTPYNSRHGDYLFVAMEIIIGLDKLAVHH
jgi:hypothetical protein